MVVDSSHEGEVVVTDKISMSKLRPQTMIERLLLILFCVTVLMLALSVYKMYIQPIPVWGLATPLDNGDAVCDEAELLTARLIDDTPCGQFVRFLVNLNDAI